VCVAALVAGCGYVLLLPLPSATCGRYGMPYLLLSTSLGSHVRGACVPHAWWSNLQKVVDNGSVLCEGYVSTVCRMLLSSSVTCVC
jgi:hypothetical protein